MRKISVVLIGTSAGGIDALRQLFSFLPKGFHLPLVIVQHLPEDAHFDLDLLFSRQTQLLLSEAHDKVKVLPGHIYFAPPGYHLLIEKDQTLSVSLDEKVHFARPSIDVLFDSAARSLGQSALGILLTGASQDGAEGLQLMKESGALTCVQDPASAQVPYMPEAALNIMTPDWVLDLKGIAAKLSQLSLRTAV